MVKHIVMFKLVDKSDENMQKAVNALRGMEGKIESLKFIEVGVDFLKSNRSYDIVLTTHFEDKAGLQNYADHPVHSPVKTLMGSICSGSVVVDYETN